MDSSSASLLESLMPEMDIDMDIDADLDTDMDGADLHGSSPLTRMLSWLGR